MTLKHKHPRRNAEDEKARRPKRTQHCHWFRPECVEQIDGVVLPEFDVTTNISCICELPSKDAHEVGIDNDEDCNELAILEFIHTLAAWPE